MNKNKVFKVLVSILFNEVGVKYAYQFNTALIKEKILDSLDFMNYITQIELLYEIKIPDTDIFQYQLGNMENMVNYIINKKHTS